MASGKFHPEVEARLRQVGQWLKRNGESVYGAEGFGHRLYYANAFMTKKGGWFYLHLFDWAPGAGCDLWNLGLKDAKRAYFLETGRPVEFMKQGTKRSYPLGAGRPVELTFDGWEGSLRLLARNTNPEPSPDTVIVFEGAVPV
jgi:alpha-L-fucosidase